MASISFRNSYTHFELLPETETRKGSWEKFLSQDLSQFDLTDCSYIKLKFGANSCSNALKCLKSNISYSGNRTISDKGKVMQTLCGKFASKYE